MTTQVRSAGHRPVATPPTPVAAGLTIGSKGRAVKELERQLHRAGFSPGKVDGVFTSSTAAALRAYQTATGKPATGIADKSTRTALANLEHRMLTHQGSVFEGTKSKAVTAAEQRLAKLGYDVGQADGIYDQQMASAVKAFRADQPDLKDKSGSCLSLAARRSLATEVNGLAHAPEHARVTANLKGHRLLDDLTATTASCQNADGTVGLGRGDKGRGVINLQEHLSAAGFNPKHKNGVFDERTEAVLRAFQAKSGLPQTGRLDPATWTKLKSAYLYANGAASPAQTVGEKSGAVLATEKKLAALGFKTGKVDGLFDSHTAAAERSFERKHHLTADGKVSAADLKAIDHSYAHRKSGLDAYRAALSVNGRTAADVKIHGPLAPYMQDDVSTHVCCANFVSACLQKAGLIPNSMHDNRVSELSDKLAHSGKFRRVDLKHAKPGDVVIMESDGNKKGHVVLFAGWDHGVPMIIGSNNVNADGSQRICRERVLHPITEILEYRG
jgi:peptidoglycan hydrolase-like protein with peptidoglycan-binding domain